MLNYNKRFSISPEMQRYIRDSTNKSLEKYLNKYTINSQVLNEKKPNCITLLPFVSLISFLVGYNLNLFLQQSK